MDMEIKVKAVIEAYSPTELATRLIESEDREVELRSNIREKDAELMHLRETNWFLKDLVANLTERGAE